MSKRDPSMKAGSSGAKRVAPGGAPSDNPGPACRFCRIVAGDESGHLVLEDEHTVAFLDNRPLFPGHTLLVPREHHEILGDLPPELIGALFASAKLLSVAVPKAMEKPGSFVALNNVVSQSVPHLHVHVVPRKPKDGLRGFFWPRTKYESEAEMSEVAGRVRKAVERAT
jgi:histidine triad (HIT) family protein